MFQVTTIEHLPLGSRIVKSDAFHAAVQADQILACARADADDIVRQAKRDYLSEKKRGYAEGRQQAQAEAAKETLRRAAEASKYFAAVESRVVEVVRRAFQKIFGEADEHELLARAARHALRWARNQSRVTLRVCPQQVASLQARVDELRAHYPAISVVDIESDEHLGRLDCVLDTEIGTVDASIESQLRAVELALQNATQDETAVARREEAKTELLRGSDSAPPEPVLMCTADALK